MTAVHELRRALRSSIGRPVAFQVGEGIGASLVPVIERLTRGERLEEAELRDAFTFGPSAASSLGRAAAGPTVLPGSGPGKSVALVPVVGMATYATEWQPVAFSTLRLAQTVTSLANDPDVGTIVLDIASPGGQVVGTAEAGDAIFAARQVKKVVAIVNPLACSAAYWLASQATQIIAIPSADVGSIGVFMMHADCSGMMEQAGVKPTFIFAGEHKVEGNQYEPLAPGAKAYMQGEVDAIYADFLKAVARGRGRTVAQVRDSFGKGRSMVAPVAKKLGMIDGIAPLDEALSRVGVSLRPAMGRRSASNPGQAITAVLSSPKPRSDSRRARLAELARHPDPEKRARDRRLRLAVLT